MRWRPVGRLVRRVRRMAGGGGLAPQVNFTGSPRIGVAPLDVTFAGSTDATAWLWEKSDSSGAVYVPFAGQATDQNPVETFAAGSWTIRLTATNDHGSSEFVRLDYLNVS